MDSFEAILEVEAGDTFDRVKANAPDKEGAPLAKQRQAPDSSTDSGRAHVGDEAEEVADPCKEAVAKQGTFTSCEVSTVSGVDAEPRRSINPRLSVKSQRERMRDKGMKSEAAKRDGEASVAGLESIPEPATITESTPESECEAEWQKAERAHFEEGFYSCIALLRAGGGCDSQGLEEYTD